MIDAALARRIELFSSTALLAELEGVLSREKFAAQLAKHGLTVEGVFVGYVALVVSLSAPRTGQVLAEKLEIVIPGPSPAPSATEPGIQLWWRKD
ncbi:MAG: hypothetical protein ACREP0_06830 [Rhodanobacteraceae bacterium]